METAKLLEIALTIALLVISLGIHEAAHGWVALKCGDSTARDQGRITLDPFAHIDLMMTIIVPTVLFLTSGFVFGGAKPVPVNFRNLRHGHRDMALVALAGPVSNIILAILFNAIFVILCYSEMKVWGQGSIGFKVLSNAVGLNLLLAVFNLVPIPPLDGSRIMTFFLPAGSLRHSYQSLERFGLFIVLAFFLFPVFGLRGILFTGMNFLKSLIDPLVTWMI